MEKIKVYDLPTRFFHWSFAASFLAAYTIANCFDDETSTFAYHILIGLTIGFMVFLRIIWGFCGGRYSRFSSLPLAPRKLLAYLHGFLCKSSWRDVGHNPASSWVLIAMLFLALGLGATGFLMVRSIDKRFFGEIHEFFANAFLALACLHIFGVVVHTLRYRDGIALSMLHGKKTSPTKDWPIVKTYPIFGVAFLLLVGLFAAMLWQHYDPSHRVLDLFGLVLFLK